MKCVIRRAEKAREYFCSFWDGQAIQVKPRDQPDIEEQQEDTRERESEEARTTNVLGKDYDTERCLFGRNGYRDFSVCAHPGNFYWFSVRSDSQRSFPHPRISPSPLNPYFPILTFHPVLFFLLPSSAICCRSSHFLLLFNDISPERVSCITAPLSIASPPPSSYPFPITISLFISQLRRVQDHFETRTIKSFTMSVK